MNPQNKLHNFHFARKYISRKNNLQSFMLQCLYYIMLQMNEFQFWIFLLYSVQIY
jgi:hypothetical protein